MAQKELPTLAGHKLRTRKRDEKVKYDPGSFCVQLVAGINKAEGNLEDVSKYLDQANSSLDYRRYAEPLLDILVAGGMLAPGGKIDEVSRANVCVFTAQPTVQSVQGHLMVVVKLLRRYKYLQKSLQEDMKKILKFLKAFGQQELECLAIFTALCLEESLVSAAVISSLYIEALVKEGLSLKFATLMFKTWVDRAGMAAVSTALKKAQLEAKLVELMPYAKQTKEGFEQHFRAAGLESLVKFHLAQQNAAVKKRLIEEVKERLSSDAAEEEIIECCQQYMPAQLNDIDVTVLLWRAIMSAVEWNKKEELVAEQALKHLKVHCPLFLNFTQTGSAQLYLLIKMQEFCYDNMNFMKVFHKIVLLFYKHEVLSEQAILKWYYEAHSSKGKSVFLKQMKKMVDWLETAEEESETEESSAATMQ